MSNAAMIMLVYKFWYVHARVFLKYILTSWIAESLGGHMSKFLGNVKLFATVAVPI